MHYHITSGRMLAGEARPATWRRLLSDALFVLLLGTGGRTTLGWLQPRSHRDHRRRLAGTAGDRTDTRSRRATMLQQSTAYWPLLCIRAGGDACQLEMERSSKYLTSEGTIRGYGSMDESASITVPQRHVSVSVGEQYIATAGCPLFKTPAALPGVVCL